MTVETATVNGQTTRRTIAGPARDFVMVAADQAIPVRKDVDGTQVTLWTAPDLDPAIAARTVEIAADVLRNYQARWGQYPMRELELVQVNPSGALGIAWSGLLFLDGPSLLEGYGERNEEGLATVVAHEISHLWWGVLVGGDSNKYGYIPEGLATTSSLLYLVRHVRPRCGAAGIERLGHRTGTTPAASRRYHRGSASQRRSG